MMMNKRTKKSPQLSHGTTHEWQTHQSNRHYDFTHVSELLSLPVGPQGHLHRELGWRMPLNRVR